MRGIGYFGLEMLVFHQAFIYIVWNLVTVTGINDLDFFKNLVILSLVCDCESSGRDSWAMEGGCGCTIYYLLDF